MRSSHLVVAPVAAGGLTRAFGLRKGDVCMRTLIAALLVAVTAALSVDATSQSLTCGIKPIPNIGCRIGRCINGQWEQICDQNPGLSCGIRPIPDVGCKIGRCVDGAWEQVCHQNPGLSCGIRPIPNIGCRIGRCVDGVWEQICN